MMKVKNLLSGVFALVTAIFLLTACSGDGGSDGGNTGDFYMRFKVDGQQKEYKTALLTTYKYHKTRGNHFFLNIGGRKEKSIDSESMTLDLYVPETSNFNLDVGDYAPSQSQYYLDVTYFFNNENHYDNPNNFVVNITQIDKNTAKGTFSGKLESGLTITEGEFYTKVRYEEVK
ncbi:hypothetical protein [Capnocytophaga stomatis]|uniref:DUF1735 domain-containing protein n=1 Tax=Capnocytophaga stomatis TaxID=1848904 RepID=A0A250FX16_9FLAO|nr:hypothetical protein [Capnocytophaga stomatis]ATA89699.1 hypothetical protein CGC58_08150 [Capnocytophaga stomatis]GIJ94673.1 hypothetical protein CAPN002_18910 [Capnocytophaga stomatis]GIM49151.1 hypothetical protein CAPN003_06030 [Capnocytophaga stomatis]